MAFIFCVQHRLMQGFKWFVYSLTVSWKKLPMVPLRHSTVTCISLDIYISSKLICYTKKLSILIGLGGEGGGEGCGRGGGGIDELTVNEVPERLCFFVILESGYVQQLKDHNFNRGLFLTNCECQLHTWHFTIFELKKKFCKLDKRSVYML